MTPQPLYLLDTNVLVHFVRGSVIWKRIRDRFEPLTATPTPRICVVTDGEIRSLAVQWGWAEKKLD